MKLERPAVHDGCASALGRARAMLLRFVPCRNPRRRLAASAAALFLVGAIGAFAFQVRDTVEVEWKGTWYTAEVLQTSGDRAFIHYADHDHAWDEWVGPERIRPPGKNPTRNAAPATSPAQAITIRKHSVFWARIEPNGTIRINGMIAGEFAPNGTVRRGGISVGAIAANGTIRQRGMIVGEIDARGNLRRNGGIVGRITEDGLIRRSGAIWGAATTCCPTTRARQAVAAALVFFDPDFGFIAPK